MNNKTCPRCHCLVALHPMIFHDGQTCLGGELEPLRPSHALEPPPHSEGGGDGTTLDVGRLTAVLLADAQIAEFAANPARWEEAAQLRALAAALPELIAAQAELVRLHKMWERMATWCPACNGTGDIPVLQGPNVNAARCPSCGGSGRVAHVLQDPQP